MKGFFTLIAVFAWGIGGLIWGSTGLLVGIVISLVLMGTGLANPDPFDTDRKRE